MTKQNNNNLPVLRIRLKLNNTIERQKDVSQKKKRKRSTSSKKKHHKKTNTTVKLPTTLLNNNSTNNGYWTSVSIEQVETNKLILRNCHFVTSQSV